MAAEPRASTGGFRLPKSEPRFSRDDPQADARISLSFTEYYKGFYSNKGIGIDFIFMPRSLYIKLPGSELFRSSFRCDCGHESDFSEIFDLPNIEQIRRLLMVELRGLRRDFEVEGTRIAGLFKGMNHGDIERVLRRAAKDMVLSGAGFLNERHIQAAVQRAVQAGIPPDWNDIPAEFQADAAALERMDDNSLWRIARARQTPSDFTRYQELLDKNRNGTISDSERNELNELRVESDRFMICKAHAAALLRWRGHRMPPPEKL